jgi:septal ring-binding cell division protein DamX
MSKEANEGPKGFASSVFLVAAVAVVVVAGMFLKTEPPHALPPSPALTRPATPLPLGTTVTPEAPAPEPAGAQPVEPQTVEAQTVEAPPGAPLAEPPKAPAADPLVQKLADRAEVDCARIAKAGGRWTAQLLVACKPETVERLLGNAGGSRGLYVLPVQVKDEACFRVCFGTYATSKDAANASDLPKALRGKEKIGAVEIAKVLP